MKDPLVTIPALRRTIASRQAKGRPTAKMEAQLGQEIERLECRIETAGRHLDAMGIDPRTRRA